MRNNRYNSPEKQIEQAIIDFLTLQGLYVFKANAGQVRTESGHMFKGVPAGTSDIIGLTPEEARFVAIEVKQPKTKNNLTDYQIAFLKHIKDNGGIAIVAWSIESLIDGFKAYGYKFNGNGNNKIKT